MASGSRVLEKPAFNAKAVKELEKKKKLPQSSLLKEENEAYEERLASLKAQMELEKEKRTAMRRGKEGATRWKSAKATAPLRSYADSVLDRARARSAQKQNRPANARQDLEGLTVEDEKVLNSPKKPRDPKDAVDPNQNGYALFFGGGSAKEVMNRPELGEVPGLSNKKAASTSGVNADLSNTKLSAIGEEGELGASRQKTQGGSLLDGEYDEQANAKSFQEALKEWRGETSGSAVTPRHPRQGEEEPYQGSLLDGHYDEIANANAFQEALDAWRNPKPVQITDMSGGWRNPFGPPDDLVAPGETQTNDSTAKQNFSSCYQCYKTFVEGSGYFAEEWDKTFCTAACAASYSNVTKLKCVHFDVCKGLFLKKDAVSVKGTMYCTLDCAAGNPKSPVDSTTPRNAVTPRNVIAGNPSVPASPSVGDKQAGVNEPQERATRGDPGIVMANPYALDAVKSALDGVEKKLDPFDDLEDDTDDVDEDEEEDPYANEPELNYDDFY